MYFQSFNFIHGILVGGSLFNHFLVTAYLESWRVVTVKAPSATTKFYFGVYGLAIYFRSISDIKLLFTE